MNLEEMRTKIDGIDRQLVDLLNERYSIVREIGNWKRENNMPIYAPEREAVILKKLEALNKGPMTKEILHSVFHEIIAGSYSIERPCRIVFVGYESSLASFAVRKYFGPSVEFTALQDTTMALKEVEADHADYAFIPVDSCMESVFGSYLEPMIYLESLQLCNAVMVPVEFALLSNSSKKNIHSIYAHPQAFLECRDWLMQNFPNAEKVEISSETIGLKLAAEQEGTAVIASPLAAEEYRLDIIAHKIEKANIMPLSFGVVSKHRSAPAGDDVTRLCYGIKDHPGAMMACLQIIADAGINALHIETRKTKFIKDEYLCVLDLSGHSEDSIITETVEKLRKVCNFVKILGTCPRKQLKER